MNINLYLAGFFAVCCYAALGPLAKKMLPDIPAFAFIALSMIALAAMAAIVSIVYEKDFSLSKMHLTAWGGLAVFALVNMIGFAVYLYVIARMPVVHYQLLALVSPVAGGVLSYLLLNEPFKPQYLAGLLLIGCGVFVAVRDWGV